MKSYEKKAVITFALTLLVTSLILASVNLPTVALPTDDLIYLHGPPLAPIHMHGPLLTPVHMHSMIGIIDPYDPWGTPWHELYPDYCEEWIFTSWEDNGNGYLDPSDQIDMENVFTREVRWWHVDRVTVTLALRHEITQELIYVEYKDETWNPPLDPLDPIIPMPICTWWHEVWPVYHGVFGPGNPYHIIDWIDNGNFYLDVCDYIMFEPWPGEYWHVEEYATDLILNEKIMDPIGIEWHEIFPSFCNWHLTTSWEEPIEDVFPGRLSPGDQIDMLNYTSQETKWYYIDRVTFTMRISNLSDPSQEWYIEYKGPFDTMYDVKTTVTNSTWHQVWPLYSPSFNITGWVDNCNGVLDFCDGIELHDLYADLYYGWWHVVELSIDIILNEKIDDPTGLIWHELYPECSVNNYATVDWEDNWDGLLNPSDNITLALLPAGSTDKYHVENMTLTLNLTVEDVAGQFMPFTPGERIYIEYLAAIYSGWEWMYYPKTHPLYTDWEVVCPIDRFGYPLTIEDWFDNCNGVLSYCDLLAISGPDGAIWVHVDEVAVDITVKKITEPTPPTWYKKLPYPDYAPSGMPDFDQKQDAWHPPLQVGHWTWCGPAAVANSLWWFDSKYDPSDIVTAYVGVPDDHHVLNVDPLVKDLAWLMDTDGQRTGSQHTGTFWWDMEWGLNQYLINQGVDDILEVHSMEFPEFFWIEEEIYRCQDVVLLLEFWYWNGLSWERIVWPYDLPGGEGGHYVTCAGVNSTTFELLICDPWWDAAEAGFPGDIPVPHPGHAGVDTTVHNDTQYVSHDAYSVASAASPYGLTWELVNYLQQLGYADPNFHTFITVAVVTSPLAEHDVAVIDITHLKTIVTQELCMFINATVENQGGFTETNVNVTVKANNTAIQSQTIPSLAPGANTTLTFTWNATGFAKGNYTISATADPVPGETDTADNTLINGEVTVSCKGDITGPTPNVPDGTVNMRDISLVAKGFGANLVTDPASPKYGQYWHSTPCAQCPHNANCDLTGPLNGCPGCARAPDGTINMRDISLVAKLFGTGGC
jgi:hypothetical protein